MIINFSRIKDEKIIRVGKMFVYCTTGRSFLTWFFIYWLWLGQYFFHFTEELQGDEHWTPWKAKMDGRSDPTDPQSGIRSSSGGVPRLLFDQRGILYCRDPPMPPLNERNGSVSNWEFRSLEADCRDRVLDSGLYARSSQFASQFGQTFWKVLHHFTLKKLQIVLSKILLLDSFC